MKVRLGGLPREAPPLPCVTLADVESVLAAWTGIPTQRMSQDDRDRLSLMEPALKVCQPALLVPTLCKRAWPKSEPLYRMLHGEMVRGNRWPLGGLLACSTIACHQGNTHADPYSC